MYSESASGLEDEAGTAKTIQDEKPDTVVSTATETVEEDIIESPIPSLSDGDAAMDDFYQQAKSLEVGNWVEWQANDDRLLRGKLTWKSAVTGTLIFVGRKGTKLAELNVGELAELLRMSKARLLIESNEPLLERAMNAMVETLKKTDPANA